MWGSLRLAPGPPVQDDAMAGSSAAFNERILASMRPNFFELLAQEAMHEALRPAVEYVCKVSFVGAESTDDPGKGECVE